MSELEKQTEWVLRNPVTIKNVEYNDMGEPPIVHLGAGIGDVPCVSVMDCDMELFKPFNRETLEQKIMDLGNNYAENYSGSTQPAAMQNFASAVVGLLYPEKENAE